jgi:hypothetical protein
VYDFLIQSERIILREGVGCQAEGKQDGEEYGYSFFHKKTFQRLND